jgi:hypothetical protein
MIYAIFSNLCLHIHMSPKNLKTKNCTHSFTDTGLLCTNHGLKKKVTSYATLGPYCCPVRVSKLVQILSTGTLDYIFDDSGEKIFFLASPYGQKCKYKCL